MVFAKSLYNLQVRYNVLGIFCAVWVANMFELNFSASFLASHFNPRFFEDSVQQKGYLIQGYQEYTAGLLNSWHWIKKIAFNYLKYCTAIPRINDAAMFLQHHIAIYKVTMFLRYSVSIM